MSGAPCRSDSSHSGREGRRIRFNSASAGEQRPSTMAWTCSAIGISTPWACASPTRGPALLMPSATMCMPADDVLERLALPEREPDRPVATLWAGAGRHQVADAGQSAESEHLPTQGDAQTPQLGKSPSNEDGAGVVPESEPVTDAGSDGHHVLGGSGDLATDDIGAHVGAECARMHQRLHATGERLVRQGHHAGGRMPLCHLAGQVRAGEDTSGNARAAPRPRPGTCAGWFPSRFPWPSSRRPRISSASGCMAVRTARKPCEGTAMKTMLTPCSASASDAVTVEPVGKLHVRQVRLVPACLRHGRCELG